MSRNASLLGRGQAQDGFSLIELLIATALGLLLLIAVSNVFLGGRQSFRTQEGMSQVQESGRLLTYLMYPYIRQAGYLPEPITNSDPSTIFTASSLAIQGTDNAAPTVGGITASTVQTSTDSITVRYRGQDGSVAGTADGAILACDGTAAAADQMVENTFYVAKPDTASGEVVGALNCKRRFLDGTGSTESTATGFDAKTPQPLLLGVQDMQILYGIDSDGDNVANRFQVASSTLDWPRVVSVNLVITIDSVENVAAGQTYQGVQGGRLRREFTTTLQIRNRLR
ncbi:MAG: PilW family protein [Pseudomonadota bacterium]